MFRVLCLLIFPLFLWGSYVHWQGDYNKALSEAQNEQKPLLVFVVKEKTPLCNAIVQKAFMNQPYIDTINRKMVAVMVTYEGSLSYPIELYYTTYFPTLFVVESKHETFLEEPLYGEEINATMLSNIIESQEG